jgi:23S rRNA maturation-related 3'-5' exoribonuclease YhaM
MGSYDYKQAYKIYEGIMQVKLPQVLKIESCEEKSIPYLYFSDMINKQEFTWQDIADYLLFLGDKKISALFTEIEDRFCFCPASTKYHSSYLGGLLDHTVRICKSLQAYAHAYDCSDAEYKSLVKCALLHDLGKLGTIGRNAQDYYIINPDSTKQATEPFINNKNLVNMPHELRSLHIINEAHVHLTEEEIQAIFYHGGMYMPGFKEYVGNATKIQYILHSADLLSTHILE